MDLNEKLAARRRELAIEAEKNVQVEEALRREQAIKVEMAKRIEKEAIDAEVARRLSEKGIDLPSSKEPHAPVVMSANVVDAEVDKAIRKAASARMTGGENAMFSILLLLGISGFFIAWWVGLAFIVWAMSYVSNKTNRYKEQIIAEGKKKVADSSRANLPGGNQIVPIAITLLAAGERRAEVLTVIRAATGSRPIDCMNIVDHTPSLVMQGMSASDAEMLRNRLIGAGAKVEMKV